MVSPFFLKNARLLSTFATINAPCSVNPKAGFLRPPQAKLDVTFCDFKFARSSLAICKIKAGGNLLGFLRTAWFLVIITALVGGSIAISLMLPQKKSAN